MVWLVLRKLQFDSCVYLYVCECVHCRSIGWAHCWAVRWPRFSTSGFWDTSGRAAPTRSARPIGSSPMWAASAEELQVRRSRPTPLCRRPRLLRLARRRTSRERTTARRHATLSSCRSSHNRAEQRKPKPIDALMSVSSVLLPEGRHLSRHSLTFSSRLFSPLPASLELLRAVDSLDCPFCSVLASSTEPYSNCTVQRAFRGRCFGLLLEHSHSALPHLCLSLLFSPLAEPLYPSHRAAFVYL